MNSSVYSIPDVSQMGTIEGKGVPREAKGEGGGKEGKGTTFFLCWCRAAKGDKGEEKKRERRSGGRKKREGKGRGLFTKESGADRFFGPVAARNRKKKLGGRRGEKEKEEERRTAQLSDYLLADDEKKTWRKEEGDEFPS